MDWDDLRHVLAVAEHGRLKDAARALGVDQATVGRRIRSLEASLGVRLLEKHSDGFVPTAAGRDVLDELRGMAEAAARVSRRVAGRDRDAAGTLRVAMPGALANHWLVPALPRFRAAHPRVTLALLTGPSVVNLARREADVAIRLVRPRQTDLHAVKLGTFGLAVYGVGEWAKRAHADPGAAAPLPMAALYPEARSTAEDAMVAELGDRVRPVLWTAAWSSVYAAVTAGLGVGILPDVFVAKEPRLTPLALVKPARPTLWLVMHPDLKRNARVEAFTAFVRGLFPR